MASSDSGTAGIPTPGKIIAVHLNYRSRAEQRGRTPKTPSYFVKPSSSLAATGDTLERPAGTELLAFEGEIAAIIGTSARRVSPEDGWKHISGLTASNDFGIYDMRTADKGSNLRSKGGDGFTPVGPQVIDAAGVDPEALRVRTWVNGALVQDDTTAGFLFSFGQLVADLSQVMTLEPGDMILTGTPAGSSVVQPGDVVEVEVDAPTAPGVPTSGRLTTTITEGTTPYGDFGTKPSTNDLQRAEAWGSREEAGLPAPFALTDEMRAKFAKTAVATLSASLRKRGHVDVFVEGVFPNVKGRTVLGLARTLRFVPFRPDLFKDHGGGYNAQKRAFDALGDGDVLVMQCPGGAEAGTLGDILALRAIERGAAGVVTDGAVRDFAAVAEFDLPVFSKGPHPSVLGRRNVPWETDVAIDCGGAAIVPGDVIVGDDDGVIVIPQALVEEVLDESYEKEIQDEWVAERVKEGERLEGLFPMNAEWKARYDAWRSQQ